MLILKSKDLNRIFGGYTDVEWNWNSGNYRYGVGNLNSFLFTFVDQQFVKLKSKYKDRELLINYCNTTGFGEYNLMIADDCNINKNSYSRLGNRGDYETNNVSEPNKYLAGE